MKTTLYTVLCIAVRLGAVLLGIGVLERVPEVLLYQSPEGHYVIGALLLEGALVLLALALWLWPQILVWWAIGRNRHEIVESTINAEQVQYIALSVTGVWMCIEALGGLAGHLVTALMKQRAAYDAQASGMTNPEWHWLIQYALMAVGGAALALGARGLTGVLHRLRGYPVTSAENDASTAQDG